jgi:hypothetical protein
MQKSAWIDCGRRILAGRQTGGPSILDPHAGSPAIDPPSLPGFEGDSRSFLFFGPPVNEMLIGRIDHDANGIAAIRWRPASSNGWG